MQHEARALVPSAMFYVGWQTAQMIQQRVTDSFAPTNCKEQHASRALMVQQTCLPPSSLEAENMGFSGTRNRARTFCHKLIKGLAQVFEEQFVCATRSDTSPCTVGHRGSLYFKCTVGCLSSSPLCMLANEGANCRLDIANVLTKVIRPSGHSNANNINQLSQRLALSWVVALYAGPCKQLGLAKNLFANMKKPNLPAKASQSRP